MLTTVMSRIDMMAPSTTTPATLRTPLSNLSLVDCGAVVVVMDKLLPAGVGPILPAGSQGSSTGFRIAWSGRRLVVGGGDPDAEAGGDHAHLQLIGHGPCPAIDLVAERSRQLHVEFAATGGRHEAGPVRRPGRDRGERSGPLNR